MTIKQAQMSTKITQIIILYASILGSCIGCQKLSSLDVPEEVRSAFAKGYPNAKFSTWDKETFEGHVVCEAEGVIVGKISRNVMYSPEGNVVQVEDTMPVADLPALITSAVSKEYPQAVIKSAEKRTHAEMVEYALKLRGATVKMVVVDRDGKIISTK
jgi:hypothetical protein